MSNKERVEHRASTHTETARTHQSDLLEVERHGTDSLHTKTNSREAASQEGYQFSFAGNLVTAVKEIEHGVPTVKTVKSNESYSLSGTDVLKTEADGIYLELSRFTDSNSDGVYQQTSGATVLNPGAAKTSLQLQNALSHSDHMKFGITGDQVLTASEVSSNGTVIKEILNVAQFSIQNGFVIEAATVGTTTHWEIYRDGNSDAIYTEVAHGSGPMVDLVGLAASLAAVNSLL